MTIQCAIAELQFLLDVDDVPFYYKSGIKKVIETIQMELADRKTEPQTDCYVSDLCKHYGDKQICGRCRSRNLFCKVEPQPRCPKCGKKGYIRSLESMGVKLNIFDEYKWKCTNCNKYFKEEPKDEPQTERPCDNCQEFDCYGCEYKQTERSE